ncbi:PPE family protein, SVP subgroup [[Mycobacterium] holstebronense]|uniref:PPE domain-containing protein n=1 Tax=[Mycobacterium] holstebronense TaxID=3064288 RepID=A0ABM9M4R5_9MYCO|nr:PPE domain-containing protein [Mycolicibacter sp. MU0102]CAJ1510147.1 PPE domain-containing protein [Mycolicibacter sp. MU0102]
MNFAALPPEVNSGLMYTGAGSGPIRAAATAWKTMAAELESAANNYRTIIAELTDQTWQGPSATAMAAAATPYAAWMSTTATKASHAGTQAAAAAVAYETAYAMTVPPAVIAANRTQLATLVATNFLGTNTAAIAATEAHYSEMWAQDATAMYAYATNATAATQLPTFTAPADATTGGSYDGAGEEGLLLNILVALLEVDSIAPFEGGGAGLEFGGLAIETASLAPFAGLGFTGDFGAVGGLGLLGDALPVGAALGVAPAVVAPVPAAGLVSTGRAAMPWAGVGKAIPVGGMSVPRAWAAAAPAALREITLLSTQSSAMSAAAAAGAELPLAEMALAGAAGRALTRSAGSDGAERRAAPVPAPKQADPDPSEEPEDTVTGVEVLAELRGLAELHESGVLTDEEFHRQRERVIDMFVDGAAAGQ